MATGLFASSWMIRLGDADRVTLLTLPGAAAFEPMPGKPMKGYAVLPRAVIADDAALEAWVRRAIDHVRGLPAKR